MTGYLGIDKTIKLVTRDYTWPGIQKDVIDHVKGCDTCVRIKHDKHKSYRLLQSPKTPNEAWESVVLDWIVKLPKSREPFTGVEYDSILIIVDRLTKYTYLVSYKEASNAEDLAYIFIKTITANYEIPKEVISNKDKLL